MALFTDWRFVFLVRYMRATCPVHLNFFDLISLIIFGEEHKLWISSVRIFPFVLLRSVLYSTKCWKVRAHLIPNAGMNVFFSYDFAFNLVTSRDWPYKYLHKHMHKYSLYFMYSKWPHYTLIQVCNPGMVSVYWLLHQPVFRHILLRVFISNNLELCSSP
jgi:hypothetical protein